MERLDELSVFIITLNEQARLPRCLDSCRFAGQIVVVDSGSTDRTLEIARAAGCEVHSTPDWPGFGPQKNRALDACRGRWVFNLDADEWISPPLADEIARIIRSSTSAEAYEVSRRCYFEGRLITCCGWWPHRVTRLWQRGKGRYRNQRVHESVAVQGRVARLVEPLDHEPYRDYLDLVRKNILYAKAGAEQMALEGRRANWLKVATAGPLRFMRDFVFKAGWTAGTTGLAIAAAQGFGAFLKYAVRWFDQQRVDGGAAPESVVSAVPPGAWFPAPLSATQPLNKDP